MLREDIRYDTYLKILGEELVPALGCTEPIAIAYACALARRELGREPENVKIWLSGNIVKNVKSVVVPNTGGIKGIKAAVSAGLIGGDPERALEVLDGITPTMLPSIKKLAESGQIEVLPAEGDEVFDILVLLRSGDDFARARISGCHTNVRLLEKNGVPTFVGQNAAEPGCADRSLLTVEGIVDFCDTFDTADAEELLDRQIRFNSAIAEEGLRGNWGANIGSTILAVYGSDVQYRAEARAAAGSDARMSGCELPVIINSGSGNQGMTVSLPVIEYAAELRVSREKLLRALALSNLLAIHLKTGLGRLSAYCGAICAGSAAGAAIAYLHGGGFEDIAHTLVNSLAIVSGIICDGAKPSCAAKISCAVNAGIFGWKMFKNGQQFYGGDGIVTKGVENTILNVCNVGNRGMRDTDREIIRIMTSDPGC